MSSEPRWVSERIEQAGQTLVCWIRTDSAVDAARASLHTLLWVTLPFLDTARSGQPTASEVTSLADVELQLQRVIGDRGMLVASVSGSDVREYLVYAQDSTWVDDLRHGLAESIAPHSVDVMVQEDPDWAGYRKYGG